MTVRACTYSSCLPAFCAKRCQALVATARRGKSSGCFPGDLNTYVGRALHTQPTNLDCSTAGSTVCHLGNEFITSALRLFVRTMLSIEI